MIRNLKILSNRDLVDLVNGAAIFSAGGGGNPKAGHKIVERLTSDGYLAKMIDSSEIPDNAKVVNFACVGATTSIDYDSDAAVKTLKILEESENFSSFAIIPVELGGFNTLAAIDVAARCDIPIVDGDGAGRSVPEVHLKVYTIDNISLTPMTIADPYAKNVIVLKEAADAKATERIARVLASEWNNSAYTARRILTGKQTKNSPVQQSLSRSIKIGSILRKSPNPIAEVLKKTDGFKLFEGIVDSVDQRTEAGFTFVDVKLQGLSEYIKSIFNFKTKNEILVAYRDDKLIGIAPDIITAVDPETGTCLPAETIEHGDRLIVLGLPAPPKWRTERGQELWNEVLHRSGIHADYLPIENQQSQWCLN